MVYKKYIKRGDKVHGPYYYESYRDESGNVKKKYIGTELKKSPNLSSNWRWIILFVGLIVVLCFAGFYGLKISGYSVFDGKDAGNVAGENSGEDNSVSNSGGTTPITGDIISLEDAIEGIKEFFGFGGGGNGEQALLGPLDDHLTPIARWDVVPLQRINAGETLNVGVVAFSKWGINRVEFNIQGQGYSGIKTATEMTLNEQTGVWEYWVPILANEFSSDGPITIDATVYGNDGGIRNSAMGEGLGQLTLVVNPTGSLPYHEAWVASPGTGGNDILCAVDNPSIACATIGKAVTLVGSGGVVYLRPGDHILNIDGLSWMGLDNFEWTTITNDPASGGTKLTTKIVGRTGDPLQANLLKIKDLTLSTSSGNPLFQETSAGKSIWLDNCNVIGSGRYDDHPHVVGEYTNIYYTGGEITNVRFAVGNGDGPTAVMARGVYIYHIGEDAFSATPLIINVNISDVDPGLPGGREGHADVWQSNGITTSGPPPTNWIGYNIRATDLHYQGIFWRDKVLGKNNAIVNVFLEMRDPVRDFGGGNSGVGSWIGGGYDHLIMWHNTFIGTGFIHDFWIEDDDANGQLPTPLFQFTNSSVKGNLFTTLKTDINPAFFSDASNEFVDNHYIVSSGTLIHTPGTEVSTLDPQIDLIPTSPDFGKPLSLTSPLVDRIAEPVVPVDIYGNQRGNVADVGAIELNTGVTTCSSNEECGADTACFDYYCDIGGTNQCASTIRVGAVCDDGVSCTTGAQCDASGVCVPTVFDDNLCSNLNGCAVAQCSPPGDSEGCVYSGCPCQTAGTLGTWYNSPFAEQVGTFTAEFDVTPFSTNLDFVAGLSNGPVSDYAGLATAIRFDNAGNIDVRNGAAYIENLATYTPGTNYHFRFVVNIASHTYEVYVTPQGGTETALGTNFAFRTEQASVLNLNNFAFIEAVTAGSQVCSFGLVNPAQCGNSICEAGEDEINCPADCGPVYGMEIESVTGGPNQVVVNTTGASYVLSRTGMEMWRRIDPATNDYNPRLVARLDFITDIGPFGILSNDGRTAVVDGNFANFTFYSDSLFILTAKLPLIYNHTNLITNAEWNKGYGTDRMWTDGYGGSLHADYLGFSSATSFGNDTTRFSLNAGSGISHMVFPPRKFDFEGLYGTNSKPHVYFVSDYNIQYAMDNMGSLVNDGFGVFFLWNRFYRPACNSTGGHYTNEQYWPYQLDSLPPECNDLTPTWLPYPGIYGYEFNNSVQIKNFVNLAHQRNASVISYMAAYAFNGPGWSPVGWQQIDAQPISETLDFMNAFQTEYDLDGWYFDNADINPGNLANSYSFMKNVRMQVGDSGIIFHHNSVDIVGSSSGFRAVMIDTYSTSMLAGETGSLAEIDEPNDPYLRYFTSGYGLSQAYGSHLRMSSRKLAISGEEAERVMAQNLYGIEDFLYGNPWSTAFKPGYEMKKAEYLSGSFNPDIDWPVDSVNGWFRVPMNIQLNWLSGTSVNVTWETNLLSDSNVSYTNNSVWWVPNVPAEWNWPKGPSGSAGSANLVTQHSVVLENLNESYDYEFRIRSSNRQSGTNEIVWGYTGNLTRGSEVCDNDGICETGENVYSCSADCLVWARSCLTDMNGDNRTSNLVDWPFVDARLGNNCTFANNPISDWCEFADVNRDGEVNGTDTGIVSGNVGPLLCICSVGPELCDGYDNDCDGSIDEEGVCPRCGNNWCEVSGGENSGNCLADCPIICTDLDTDGYNITGGVCGEIDCDDGNINVNPGVSEICNGIDDDCNEGIDENNVCPVVNYYCDGDGDNFNSSIPSGSCGTFNCLPVGCSETQGNDCNDGDVSINPGAADAICNGIDENCFGGADEQYVPTQSPSCGVGACTGGTGQIICVGGIEEDTCNPLWNVSLESCSDSTGYDGVDQACDGTPDLDCSAYCDQDNDTYSPHLICGLAGYGIGDCNDNAGNINPGELDMCDGIDNDCDAGTADGFNEALYGSSCDGGDTDLCDEGTYQCNGIAIQCSDNTPGNAEVCNGIDDNCAGGIDENWPELGISCTRGIGECQASGIFVCNAFQTNTTCNAISLPPSIEQCDGLDNNCNGQTDEQSSGIPLNQSCYTGLPGTQNIGICVGGTQICSGGVYGSCIGEVTPQTEICDIGFEDENCDRSNNEGCDCTNGEIQSCGSDVGECVSGNQTCVAGSWALCVGETTSRAEECDGLDNDCDGNIDEDVLITYYLDSDGDTYGDLTQSVEACTQPIGYVLDSSDCNDLNSSAYPGANEICDGIDNDCDSLTDEGGSLCSDGIACTLDECNSGACEYSDNNAQITGNVYCNQNDGNQFCNGYEYCSQTAYPLGTDAFGCVAGTLPVIDDEIICTEDSCDEFGDQVVHAPNNSVCTSPEECLDFTQIGTGCALPGFCGNETVEIGEQCDGANLSEETCISQGYPAGGNLGCNTSCSFDYSGCSLLPLYSKFNGNTTNFTNVGNVVVNPILEIKNYGMINFTGHTINFERMDLDRYVFIEDRLIGVDLFGERMNALNVSAVLRFYNITLVVPKILRDGAICPENICNGTNYNTTTQIFEINVLGFSNYTVVEDLYCGDGACNNGETCGSCSGDCGACPDNGGGGGGGGGGGNPQKAQCNDKIDNDLDGAIDYPNDLECSSTTDNSELSFVVTAAAGCIESWTCGDYGACADGIQTRTCEDENGCGTTLGNPETEQACEEGGESFGENVRWDIVVAVVVAVIGFIAFVIGMILWLDKKMQIKKRRETLIEKVREFQGQ